MKILVTGGSGFIGSNFIKFILNRYSNYKLINLDKLTYAGNHSNLQEIESNLNYSFIKADIGDFDTVLKAMQNDVDAVINFAAESHVDRSILNPQEFTRTNILGTHVLLEAARTVGIKKFIQISTDEVYGTLGPKGYFTEQSPLLPNSPYSASKAGADCLVRAYHETFGMDINITRCSNNYGPFQFPEKLIPLMVINALSGERLPVYGDGLNIRDWLHVKDHCRAIDLVLHGGRPGEVYNVGGHNERTNIEIVRFILDDLDKPKSLIHFVDDRKGHDRRYAIDATKIRKELGWEPLYTFTEGLHQTIKWYVENSDWVQNVLSGEYTNFKEYCSRYGELK